MLMGRRVFIKYTQRIDSRSAEANLKRRKKNKEQTEKELVKKEKDMLNDSVLSTLYRGFLFLSLA